MATKQILLVKNPSTGKQVLLLADDSGRGDEKGALIDVTEGPALTALGGAVEKYDSKGGVAAASGLGNLEISVIAKLKDGVITGQGVEAVTALNVKGGNLSELSQLVDFRDGVNPEQTIAAAEVNGVPVQVTGAYAQNRTEPKRKTTEKLSQGYALDRDQTEQENKRRQQDQILANIAALPPEEQFVMMLLCVLFAIIAPEEAQSIIIAPEEAQSMFANFAQGRDASGADVPTESSLTPAQRGVARSMSTPEGRAAGVDISGLDLKIDPKSIQPVEGLNVLQKGDPKSEEFLKQKLQGGLDPYLYKGRIEDIPKDATVAVIDVGHLAQGDGSGACECMTCVDPKTGKRFEAEVSEKAINVAAAPQIAKELHSRGVYVLSTSQAEAFKTNNLSPNARADFMQDALDGRGDKGIAIILHTNSAPGAKGMFAIVNNDNLLHLWRFRKLQLKHVPKMMFSVLTQVTKILKKDMLLMVYIMRE